MADDSRRTCLDDDKVEMMIVCQQFIRNARRDELREIIEEAIDAYIEQFGVDEWITSLGRKRGRED